MKQVTDLHKRKKIIAILKNELRKNPNIRIYFGERMVSFREIRSDSKIEVLLHRKSNYIEVLLVKGSTTMRFIDNYGRTCYPVFQIQPYGSREPEIDPPVFSYHNRNMKLKFVRKGSVYYAHKQTQQKVKTFSINKRQQKRRNDHILYSLTKKF